MLRAADATVGARLASTEFGSKERRSKEVGAGGKGGSAAEGGEGGGGGGGGEGSEEGGGEEQQRLEAEVDFDCDDQSKHGRSPTNEAVLIGAWRKTSTTLTSSVLTTARHISVAPPPPLQSPRPPPPKTSVPSAEVASRVTQSSSLRRYFGCAVKPALSCHRQSRESFDPENSSLWLAKATQLTEDTKADAAIRVVHVQSTVE